MTDAYNVMKYLTVTNFGLQRLARLRYVGQHAGDGRLCIARVGLLSVHVPTEMLSPLLGHSNPKTTSNIYADVLKPLVDEPKRTQAAILTEKR
jgi:integrase